MKGLPFLLAGLAALVTLGLLSSIISQGFQEVTETEAECERLRQEKQRLQERILELERTLEALRTDPRAVESLARRDLGWVRPGEQVILIATPTPVPAPSTLTEPVPTPILSLPE